MTLFGRKRLFFNLYEGETLHFHLLKLMCGVLLWGVDRLSLDFWGCAA